jgi:uncharacterized membrane protein
MTPHPQSELSSTRSLRTFGARTRLAVMLSVGVVLGVVTGLVKNWDYAPVVGWDGAALVFSVWVWTVVARMSAATTKSHATRENPGRAVSDTLMLVASVASLAAVGVVLVNAASAKGATQGLLAGFGVASIAVSWFAVHTVFTLRYALLYYTGADGGVDFNQKDLPPRYLDFAYLAFTIGMTFQVSDTNITKSTIRATALRHALLSYLFGAVILASSINLVVSLGSSGG